MNGATLITPASDPAKACAVLLKSLQTMCSHNPEIIEDAGAACPELVPNPLAVVDSTGYLALTTRQAYDLPSPRGWQIGHGDTLVIDPRQTHGPGDVLLVSDGAEFTLMCVQTDGSVTSLRDPDFLEGMGALLIGVVVELRKGRATQKVGAQ